ESPTAEGTLAGAACAKGTGKRDGRLGGDIFLPLRPFARTRRATVHNPGPLRINELHAVSSVMAEKPSEAGIGPLVKRSAELMPHNLSRERNLSEPLKIRADWVQSQYRAPKFVQVRVCF